ncbi:fimbrillin family protein [Prevotella herbatica]|uniref:receptor protein-tyrosine kinase n=1 Tax=Prevotella herbatica TaxID=2801997 RepID=A0ABM7NZ96_9BACT|nr:fimbrillin family protein [Prevotella herbatica]BCS85839.1 fimbrillin family protein [Prevotella herbatica]
MGKKYLLRINVSLLLLIIISTFSSCTGETNMLDGNNNKQINFSVSVPGWKNTDSLSSSKTSRATPIQDASFGADQSFNLIADQNDGIGNYSTLINSQAVTCTNNLWKTSSDYYWSGTANKTINFYAYYPTSIFNLIPHSSAGSTPAFSYTIPDNVANQIDIITATSTNIPGNTVVPTSLTFKHIFAAIQFSVGSDGIGSGTISSISIGNVANSGTYTFGSGWSNVTGSKTFTISQSKTITGTSGEDIYSGTYTLMMIPQTINNVTITITYSNGGTLTKVISGGSWEAGNIYNYKLAFIREYNYTGAVQSFTAPISGTYKIECWGAQGGGITNKNISGVSSIYSYLGANGAYTKGNISLNANEVLYIYIGQCPGYGDLNIDPSVYYGGYNGGGNGWNSVNEGLGGQVGGPGGGATDIRLINGTWNNFTSLKNRIMVAAGGAGTGASSFAGEGGTLTGLDGVDIAGANAVNNMYRGTGGSQTSAGNCADDKESINGVTVTNTLFYMGGFGYGGNSYTGFFEGGSGGGGGYYGGGASCRGHTNGGGGSSFISGYTGCNAISDLSTESNIVHTGSSNHYSGYIFTNSQMIAGNAVMPSPFGGTETGHTGNGYARITFVSAN